MPGRNPLAVYMLIFCLISSITFALSYLTGNPSQQIIQIPLPILVAWNLLLFFGSGIALVGVFLRDNFRSVLLERAGLKALLAGCVAFAAETIAVGGATNFWAVTQALIVLSFAGACFARIRQIRTGITSLVRPFEDLTHAQIKKILEKARQGKK